MCCLNKNFNYIKNVYVNYPILFNFNSTRNFHLENHYYLTKISHLVENVHLAQNCNFDNFISINNVPTKNNSTNYHLGDILTSKKAFTNHRNSTQLAPPLRNKLVTNYIQKRYGSNNTTYLHKLLFSEFGEPECVLKYEQEPEFPCPENDCVGVKVLMSPINVADINTIQGTYPDKPKSFPAVPGMEGVGEITSLGENSTRFKLGDRVVPLIGGLGWWRNQMIAHECSLFKIPKNIHLLQAATLSSPATAYRLLKDFVCLKPDDVVIQNAANATVGTLVIQLCKIWGIKTINIIRDRPNLEEMKAYLKCLGADSVVTEKDLACGISCDTLGKPKLGLNAVGGKNAEGILKMMCKKSSMVTYGGMSRQPFRVPVSPLVFKGITLKGFWFREWQIENMATEAPDEMINEIICYYHEGLLQTPPNTLIRFNNYMEGIKNTMNGMKKGKYIMDIGKPTQIC